MKLPVKILGAGLGGLSAAINLAGGGRDVIVYEKRRTVGLAGPPNFQSTRRTISDFRNYLKSLGLKAEFEYRTCSKATLVTRNRILDVTIPEPACLVCRGDKKSLEYGLYKTALEKGIKFGFDSAMSKSKVDIVSSGPSRADMVAYGAVYENECFDRDRFLLMFDDRFSPKGWYFYITPHFDGTIEAVNVVGRQHAPFVKPLFYKAIEREGIKEIIGNRKEICKIGGVGTVELPKSAVKDGRYYVGEAAGFQDPFMGFGMNFALESGKLAADAILHGRDYDSEWKRMFLGRMKFDFARRFIMSVFGDRVFEFILRRFESGDMVDIDKTVPKGAGAGMAIEIAYLLEKLKKRVIGYW